MGSDPPLVCGRIRRAILKCAWSNGVVAAQALLRVPGEPEVTDMAEGGFLVKFDGKRKPQRCYAVAFDYDEWSCVVNEKEKKEIPKGTKRITIEVER